MIKKTIIFFIIFMTANYFFVDIGRSDESNKNPISILGDINYDFWLSFNDKNLNKYIVEVLDKNPSLKIANLKIKEYNEYAKYSFGGELPTVSTTIANYNTHNPLIPSSLMKENGFVMPLSLNYEIDLFGKNRSKTRAVKKQLEAYKQELKTTNISLVSSMSTIYFNIIKINEVLNLENKILENKKAILLNNQEKLKNNLISQIDLNTIKQDINDMELKIEDLNKNKLSLLSQFAILMGKNPTNLNDLKVSNLNDINIKNKYFAVNSDVIFNRPDVLAAELEMQKADIDVSVARKEFLPSFNMSGMLLFNNIGSGGFFNSANTIKSLMFNAGMPLFSGGRKRANLKMKQYKYEQMIENYKKVSLDAIKEVNDIIYISKINQKMFEKNKDNLEMEVFNLEKYEDMYINGLISLDDFKKVEQKSFAAQINKIQAQIQTYIDCISLYKATGGNIFNL